MAARLMRNKARVIAYLPSLRSAVRHFRAFSSYDEKHPSNEFSDPELLKSDVGHEWPDSALGFLNPTDPNFPMPGNIGLSPHLKPQQPGLPEPFSESDLFTGLLPHERHLCAVESFVTASREIDAQEGSSEYFENLEPSEADTLECIATDCPQVLRKDFQELFPERNIMDGTFTVISISQKTAHDMTQWNPEVDEEREELLEHFMVGAEEICGSLAADGYWADFVDPSSGRPFLGPYTNATMFETDERYKNFGFEIEDLGCCKVISHHVWGTHAYVGCLFTNAPLSHPALVEFQKKAK